MIQNLDMSGKLTIEIAQKLAKDHNHITFGSPHLLMATLNTQVGLGSFLSVMDKDLSYLKSWAQYRIDEYKNRGVSEDEPEADEEALNVLNVAKTFMLMFNLSSINAKCILAAISRPGVGFPKGQIGSLRLTEEEITQGVLSDASLKKAVQNESNESDAPSSSSSHSPSDTKTFLQFCIDKISLAQQGKIDPIFGRDAEIMKMENILCRRTKPNVMITGEPGVGKTALVDGFALKIINGEVSDYFKDAKLYQLDIGALVAGASYRGEVEDRLKKILQEIKRLDKVILFIDEIHMILDSNSGAAGVANLLKPELARGEINLIGATTNKEYRLHIEKDAAFTRRFEVLQVEEPNLANAIKMVSGLKSLFEEHHKFNIDKEAVTEAVAMAKRYFPQRRLPDSAIDLMDRTMAAFRILEDNITDRLEKAKTLFEEQKEEPGGPWQAIWEEISSVLSPLALASVDQKTPESAVDNEGVWQTFIEETLVQVSAAFDAVRENINTDDIAAMVAIATGIPTGKIQGDEQSKLMGLEDIFKSKVIGQDHAADIIAKAIRRGRSGLAEEGKPIGSFFLVGPTGTGKTELAKTITETLFNDKENLIRFDMSEFMESHTVSLLKGSPPGYVGYGEGGQLVNLIREKPYSVVLFDEIEKAHPDVLKLLLQVLDEGQLTDTLGKKGKFADAVIMFTSNLQSEWIVKQFEEGNMPEEADIRDRILASGEYNLRPEFLNRIDKIIPFAPLSKEDLVGILDLQLKRFAKPLVEKKIKLELTAEAKSFLVDQGYAPAFGARPLKRTIDTFLGTQVSDMLISGKLQEGNTLLVDCKEDKLSFEAQ